MKKSDIYKSYGITLDGSKLASPIGPVSPMLINGNAKLGKGVWTFSTLPGTADYSIEIDGQTVNVRGTCACNCAGCYARSGFYRMKSTIQALGIRTYLARNYTGWLVSAIVAQVKADGIRLVRIHASGDFFDAKYINAWREIATRCPETTFWTYTKNVEAVGAFDDLANINVVKSMIPGCGYNFGHCDYVLDTYNKLVNDGETPYICRCGVDKNQHCVNCKGCSANKYVLFIEHSTAYKAESDPLFPTLVDLINSQARV